MPVPLAQKLLRSGVLTAGKLEELLLESVQLGRPLMDTLARRLPEAVELAEQELARVPTPSVALVRPLPALVDRLPRGMCARLGAVPVRVDTRTGAVDVATCDVLDPHIAAEFSDKLDAPVRLVRAEYFAMAGALSRLPDAKIEPTKVPLKYTPAPGSAAMLRPPPSDAPPATLPQTPHSGRTRVSTSPQDPTHRQESEPPEANPSQPPIPLVRRSLPDFFPRRGTDPGVGELASPLLSAIDEDESGEPVIGLFRSKPPPPPSVPSEALGLSGRLDAIADVLVQLASTDQGEVVLDQVVAGVSAVAATALVFALRGDHFEGRRATPRHAISVRTLSVGAREPSVLSTAVSTGHYLGPIPRTPTHEGLLELLGADAEDEVYVVPVQVSSRPALVIVLAGLTTTFAATRRADTIADAASEALTRIVQQRKRSGPASG